MRRFGSSTIRASRAWSVLIITLLLVVGGGVVPSPAAAATPTWRWPVAAPHPIVRPFLAPLTRYSTGHRGIDIGAADTRLVAPADGTVHFAGTVVDRGVLSIAHPGGLISSYEPVVTTLEKGDRVRRGDPVGTLQPGHCSMLCLHFGVRLGGEYVSPLLYLGDLQRSVLLPTRATRVASLSSGAGVGHRVALFEPLGRDVRVDLRGSEAGVAEKLLHRPKIRSPVEQVGGGGVPQGVRSGGSAARHVLEQVGDERVHRPRTDARSPRAEEEGRYVHARGAHVEPGRDRVLCRDTEGHNALLRALAQYAHREAAEVDVVQV
jgi:hypothetical protein